MYTHYKMTTPRDYRSKLINVNYQSFVIDEKVKQQTPDFQIGKIDFEFTDVKSQLNYLTNDIVVSFLNRNLPDWSEELIVPPGYTLYLMNGSETIETIRNKEESVGFYTGDVEANDFYHIFCDIFRGYNGDLPQNLHEIFLKTMTEMEIRVMIDLCYKLKRLGEQKYGGVNKITYTHPNGDIFLLNDDYRIFISDILRNYFNLQLIVHNESIMEIMVEPNYQMAVREPLYDIFEGFLNNRINETKKILREATNGLDGEMTTQLREMEAKLKVMNHINTPSPMG